MISSRGPAFDTKEWQKERTFRKLGFFEYMLYHYQRVSTDSKDMVYGLAALANATDNYQISVDYSLTVAEIYIGLVNKTLEILTRAYIGPNPHMLPSWVPDWSRDSSGHHILYSIREREFVYRAGGTTCQAAIMGGVGILALKVVVIGYIEMVGEASSMKDLDDLECAAHAYFGWWSLVVAAGDSGQKIQTQFGRTLIYGRATDGGRGGWGKEEFSSSILGAYIRLCREILPKSEIDPSHVEHYSYMIAKEKELAETGGWEYIEREHRDLNLSLVRNSAD